LNLTRKDFAPAAALLAAVFVFFWQLVSGRYVWFEGGPDIVFQVLPWYQMQAAALHSGQVALWDPYQFGGEGVLGQVQPGLLNPFLYLLLIPSMFGGHVGVLAFAWYFVLLHACAALAAFWLFRTLGCRAMAAFTGALFYGIAGVGGNVGWPQVICGMIFPPLVLLFLIRSERGIRPITAAALAGCCLGLSWYSGHPAIPLLLTVGVAIAAPLRLIGRPHDRRATIYRFGICLGIAALISAPQTCAALEFSDHALRWVGLDHPVRGSATVPYSAASALSVSPAEILTVLLPGDLSPKNSFGGWLFVGFAGLFLCAWALRRFPRNGSVRLFSFVALAGLLFALGRYTPFHRVAYLVIPFLEKLREPVFGLAIFHLGMAGLVALGADELLRKLQSSPWFAVRNVLFWCVLGVLVIEQANVSGKSPQTKLVPTSEAIQFQRMAALGNVVDWLRKRPDLVRVSVNREEVGLNLGDEFGIEQLSGYAPAVFEPFFSLGWWRPSVQRLYGVNYYLGTKPSVTGQVQLFADLSGMKVFSNPGAFPRSWIVHNLIATGAGSDLAPFLDNPDFDLAKTALLDGPQPRLESCSGPESVRVAQRSLNFARLEATLSCRGMVVLSDNNYPGWRATVDGHAATIYPAYRALRGFTIDRGTHEIEMEFRPDWVYYGSLLALLGAIATVALIILERRQFRWARPPLAS
jgi:hypothetical protein